MSDDQHRPPGPPPAPPGAAPPPPAGEGATQLFNLKLDSWLTDFVADLHAPAGAPSIGLEGTPLEGAPPAAPAEDPYRASAPVPAPYAPAPPDPMAGRHASSPDAFGGPSPLALAPQAPDPYAAPPPDPSATSGVHAASAVPPIPAFAASAVPPIPGLAGGAPQFEEKRGRWPVVLALLLVLLAVSGVAVWVFFEPQLRALLHR